MRFPRSSGVLLHPTSLPGPHGAGDFGADARRFVDWLAESGQRLWQILPLGGIGMGDSPYMSTSAFAGNVLMVDLAELAQQGWLDADDLVPDPAFEARQVRFDRVIPWRMARLAKAHQRFAAQAAPAARQTLDAFADANADWLPDYALFMAIAEQYPDRDWAGWPAPLRRREAGALAEARQRHAERIGFWVFAQWCFFRQWAALRAYAQDRGVRIVGDAPIFLAHHSAECWARPGLFLLGDDGRPTVVAGVPPDAFSATGQRWGNPLYRWDAHAADGYAWWVQRVRRTFELVDVVRIDHFRGFAGYWEIPADEPTAERGRWVPGPGAALFEAISRALGPLPIIAEDLGVITPEVDSLRRRFAFPGMRILQFAFGSTLASESRFLPHNYTPDSVVYTGTHDNDTTLGWWAAADDDVHRHAGAYLGPLDEPPHRALIRAACASVADTAVYPMQDVLGLDGAHRMNLPGTASGNWGWRFEWAQLAPEAGEHLRRLCALYERDGRTAG